MVLSSLFYAVMLFDVFTHLQAHVKQKQTARLGRAIAFPLSIVLFVLLQSLFIPWTLAWVYAGLVYSLILALTQSRVAKAQTLKRMGLFWVVTPFLYLASTLFFSITHPLFLALGWVLSGLILWGYTKFKAPRTLKKTFRFIPYRFPFAKIDASFWDTRLFLVQSKKLRLPMNALLFGKGEDAKILFSAPLLVRLKSRHIEGVIAHEMGHDHHRHLQKRGYLVVFFVVLLYLFGVLTVQQAPLLNTTLRTYVMGVSIWLVVFKYSLFALLHHQEYQADAYAHRFALEGELAEALEVIDRYLRNTHPSSLFNKTQQTHPITTKRIARLKLKESS